MKYRILFLAAALICSTSHALTVRDALIAAYKNNQELLTTRQAIIAKHETIVQAKGGFRPKIEAIASGSLAKSDTKSSSLYGRDGLKTKSETRDKKGTIKATQNLFSGFADVAKVSKAEHDIFSTWAQLKAKEQEIFLNVIKAYLDLYAKYAAVEVYKANLKSMHQNYEATATKRGIGEETITQESLAEANYAAAQSKLESGLADLETAKATFEQLTGLVAPERVDHPKELVDVPASAEQLQEITLRENPQITQAVEALASAKQDKKIATGGLLPTIDLEVATSKDFNKNETNYNHPTTTYADTNGTDTTVNNSVGLTISVPLYERGTTRSQRRQASETIVQQRINIEKVRKDLTQACRQAYRTYIAAKTNRDNTAKQVKAQEVAVDGTTQEMAVGTKLMLDVLNAQTQLVQARLDQITAVQNYYFYLYQMFSLQGKLTAEGLGLPVEIFHPEENYNAVKGRF